jgi:prepilin-type N-terminal cleavage/methylation domain-containing protein
MRTKNTGFTLAELLVSISVLVLLILFISQLVNQTQVVTSLGHTRMDADGGARQLLDRMIVDFDQMVKRADVDYYVKSAANMEVGNDQIAFYSMVPGYYPASGAQSPLSLVAYRINGENKMERMSKGLVWNAVSAANIPIVFLPLTISATWPTAATTAADADYESLGAQIFRFEYAYLLADGTLSVTPWQVSAGHSAIDGMRDVVGIQVSIAAMDSKGRALVTDAQISSLAGSMSDFAASMAPGDLLSQWQSAVDGATTLPRPTLQGVRLYERQFRIAK